MAQPMSPMRKQIAEALARDPTLKTATQVCRALGWDEGKRGRVWQHMKVLGVIQPTKHETPEAAARRAKRQEQWDRQARAELALLAEDHVAKLKELLGGDVDPRDETKAVATLKAAVIWELAAPYRLATASYGDLTKLLAQLHDIQHPPAPPADRPIDQPPLSPAPPGMNPLRQMLDEQRKRTAAS